MSATDTPTNVDQTGSIAAPVIDHEAELAHLENVAVWLDNRFRIPGTDIRFGIDSLIGFVPVVGDVLAFAPSAYMIRKAVQLGLRKRDIARMVTNTSVDFAAGLVPIAGDLFDIWFKNNLRNVAILRRHLENDARRHANEP